MRVENLKELIGSRISLSKAELLDQAVADECLKLLDERVVLVFPELHLNDQEQLAFTDLLGERISFTKNIQNDEDDVYQVTLDPKLNFSPEYVLGTFFWHMDGAVLDVPPPKATLLSARKISATGGQTEFSNCFAAYDLLPDAEKAELEGLHVHHSAFAAIRPVLPATSGSGDWDGPPMAMDHPLVWTHKSGRRSLLIGTHADEVLEKPLAEGRALLARLLEWAGRPEFTYRHEWREGDFVIWNNCGSLHRVVPYASDSGRKMHRTSIAGSEKVA